MEREQRTIAFDLSVEERGDDKKKKIVGYCSVFNQETDLRWFRESVAPGAFSETISRDDIRALFNHDGNFVLGRTSNGTLTLREDERGLYMEVDPPDTQAARDVMALIDRRDVTGQSFSFTVDEEEWSFKKDEPDKRTLKRVSLYDVGPVTFPAYEGTRVDVRSYEQRKKDAETPPEPELPRCDYMRQKLLLHQR